ncbi:MAG: hypothetical protein Q8904_03170 [Bacteroidota bacterium]|nr:hypothetical protein [Bacteroidota bacterium]MDP4268921.1 hypothetical protein [Bacteroidota bacterium]
MKKIFKLVSLSFIVLLFFGFISMDQASVCAQNVSRPSNEILKPVSEVVGIAHVNGRYNFTNKPYLIEGAEEILKLGSKCIKVWFNDVANKYSYNSKWPTDVNRLSYVDLAKTLYFKELFNMPFKTYSLEMTDGNIKINWRDGFSEDEIKLVSDEYYALTKYLLTTYRNTGKTFIFQNWEADGHLATKSHTAEETKIAIQGMIDWTNTRQDAVDRARAEVGMKGVVVANAFEVNMVFDNWTPPPYAIDEVVPHTHNDLYSYSSYSSRSLDKLNTITQRLNYIKTKTPPSKLYGEHNLMIGEFGYEERRYPYTVTVSDSTANVQLLSVKTQLEYLLNWGVVYVFDWQIYCNEISEKNTRSHVAVHDNNQYKGYWLRRADGSYTPTYNYFKKLFQEDKPVKTYVPFLGRK